MLESKQQPKRNILLMALGTTPHLTTVTLSAIYKSYPNEMPQEIHIITTKLGAQKARDAYQNSATSILDHFYSDYGLPPVTIPEAHIHVIPDAEGKPLDDIRTQVDGSGAADFIVNLVREFCSDPQSALHVSIVGGRKSMSLLLGSAMTFYGRDQDRISHVLSSERQEKSGLPYPFKEQLEEDSDVVSLGEIPFLRLRPILPKQLLDAHYSYGEVIAASQAQLTDNATVEIVKNKNKWQLLCESVSVKPETRCMGLYTWLAIRKKLGRVTETTYNTVPLERFFFLRLQYVKVLEMIQTEVTWQKACELYLGLSPDRIKKIERKLRNECFEDYKKYYQAFTAQLTQEELSSMAKAAKEFSLKLSNPRTKVNDKITEVLSEHIPDVTNRRLSSYLIQSNEQKDACIYELSVRAENIHLPAEFLMLFEDRSQSPLNEWKRI